MFVKVKVNCASSIGPANVVPGSMSVFDVECKAFKLALIVFQGNSIVNLKYCFMLTECNPDQDPVGKLNTYYEKNNTKHFFFFLK